MARANSNTGEAPVKEKKQMSQMGDQLIDQNDNDGKALFMEPGETMKGIFLGEGRTFKEGQENKETKTFDFGVSNGDPEKPAQKFLIPQHTVLKNTFAKIKEEYDGVEGKLYCEIEYQGKKESSTGGKYEGYQIYTRAAKSEEIALIGNLIPADK